MSQPSPYIKKRKDHEQPYYPGESIVMNDYQRGIATLPKMFQKAMNDIFGDLEYIVVHIDDIPSQARKRTRLKTP